MPILVRKGAEANLIPAGTFPNEGDLELILSDFPNLLGEDEEGDVQFVDHQVTLPEGGRLDLLFVNGAGLLIVVETKLASNPEARREVVAQGIDYLSSLTLLTGAELDQRVNGKLKSALHKLASDDSEFEPLWAATTANLRDGRARLVVALDEAPPDLQRIFRFLARKSSLEVHLISVQRYSSPNVGEVFVPQILVRSGSADGQSAAGGSKEQHGELFNVADAYNKSSEQDLEWAGPRLLGYSFRWHSGHIDVQLNVHGRTGLGQAQAFSPVLSPFAGETVVNGQIPLDWDQNYKKGRGRLFAEFPASTAPDTIAQAMRDLISMTRTAVADKLKALASAKAAGAAA